MGDMIITGRPGFTGADMKDGAGHRAVNYVTLHAIDAVQGVPLPGTYAALSKGSTVTIIRYK
jgi:hypothetical protein